MNKKKMKGLPPKRLCMGRQLFMYVGSRNEKEETKEYAGDSLENDVKANSLAGRKEGENGPGPDKAA